MARGDWEIVGTALQIRPNSEIKMGADESDCYRNWRAPIGAAFRFQRKLMPANEAPESGTCFN
jgi:hypothetical protein